MEVVYEIAASQNENAFFPQCRETLAYFVVERRWLHLINAELNHWNISLRIDVVQNRPGAVVETPDVSRRTGTGASSF
jgi:hypothetical protein